MFNLRILMKVLREYKKHHTKAASIAQTKRAEIEALKQGVEQALIFAFLAYTPFLKHEIVARVLIFLLVLLAKTGLIKVNGYLASVKEAMALSDAYVPNPRLA